MTTYTVSDVADMLNVNEETVRRWIRSGELKSEQTSRKKGNCINEHDLDAFMRKHPKYERSIRSYLKIEDSYADQLQALLATLLRERNMLDKRINELQKLLEKL